MSVHNKADNQMSITIQEQSVKNKSIRRHTWSWKEFKKRSVPFLLMAPGIIAVLIAMGYPLIKQIIMSFQEYGLEQSFGAPPKWVMFDNYTKILTDPYFWQVFLKSVLFCAWTAGITMILAIALAVVLLKAGNFGRGFLNTVLIVVWGMPLLASLTVWLWLIDPHYGPVDWVLNQLGLTQFHGYNWLADSYWTFFLVASLIIIWASIPLASISIYAAMVQIPKDIIEAADIDGASERQITWNILIPSVSSVIGLIGVLQLIWDLRVFTQIYVLQQSGANIKETNLLGTYVFQEGISNANYGVASALSMVILLLTLIITSKYLHMLFKQGDVR